MQTVATSIAGVAAVFFAALMLFQRSLYGAALCLLVVLLQAALLFFLSGASLIAFLQVMIYAGAVLVLIVVTVMAAPSPVDKAWAKLSIPRPLAAIGLILPLLELALVLSAGGLKAPGIALGPDAQAKIGAVLFGPLALATEAVALLMFLAGLALVPRPRRESRGS